MMLTLDVGCPGINHCANVNADARRGWTLMVCSHWPTPIKNGLYRLVWRCSYWQTQAQSLTPTPTQMQLGFKPIVSVKVKSVSVSDSVNTL